MFEIKARVYDLQATPDEMHRIKWGLFRDTLYQAEQYQKFKVSDAELKDFIDANVGIQMHEWITRVLEHGYMRDHERLMEEIERIFGEVKV